MEVKEKKIKSLLYTLYVLNTYKRNEHPTKSELNSLMLKTLETIDKEVINKEDLITRCKNKLRTKIQNHSISPEDIVEFKIGDIITTGLSSSMISLKFIFKNDDSKPNKMLVRIFENDILQLTIKI